MKAYLIRIVASALLVTFCDMLAPKGWKKYMSIVTGLLLLAILLEPVAKLQKIDFFTNYQPAQAQLSQGTQLYAELLQKEFSKNLSTDIKERILTEFSIDVSVETIVETDDAGNLLRIPKIIISGKDLPEKIQERIAYIYDVDEVILRAD